MNNIMALNAELYRQLAKIASDEVAMKKLLNYVKRLVLKLEAEKKATTERETLTNS